MLKCYKHIGLDSNEWCWKCQELIDANRLNNKHDEQLNKIINGDRTNTITERDNRTDN
jgi:hypothetical protein